MERRRCLAGGARDDEIVATLIDFAPVNRIDRVVASAAALANAIGYGIDSALEKHQERRC
jgi:hypothetical protein